MRSATMLLLAGACCAGWTWAEQPPATAPLGGLAPPALLIEEPPAGHVEVMLSGSRGAALDSGALARFLPVLHTPGFLDSSSQSTADPLAPCALLSAAGASAHLNLVWGALINRGHIDSLVPKGTNMLGHYDDELARAKGGVPRDDPSKSADIVARVVILRSWGASTQANTLLAPLKQRQCLELLIDHARLGQAMSKLPHAGVRSHAAPVSAYITSVSRNVGNEWLAALPKPEMLGMSSVPTGNPLMPCEMLSAFRLAARVNDALNHRLPAGKLDADGRPELAPYAEALKRPLGTGSVDEAGAELLAAASAAEIVRSNWLSAQLLDKATQGECLAEMFQPGVLRTKLQRAGTTLPLR